MIKKQKWKIKALIDAFNILASYPNTNWEDAYMTLFSTALEFKEYDIAKEIFYQIIIEDVRNEDPWMIEQLLESDNSSVQLKKLNLYDFSLDLLPSLIKQQNSRPKRKRKFNSENNTLCACCHDFILTKNQIQQFPLRPSKEYITKTWKKALAEKDQKKRFFLLERLLCNYGNKKPDLNLLLDLWFEAEQNGAHFDCIYDQNIIHTISNTPELFLKITEIITHTHDEHDGFIDDLSTLAMKKNEFDRAYYLNSKISNEEFKIISAVWSIGSIKNNFKEYCNFLKRVYRTAKKQDSALSRSLNIN